MRIRVNYPQGNLKHLQGPAPKENGVGFAQSNSTFAYDTILPINIPLSFSYCSRENGFSESTTNFCLLQHVRKYCSKEFNPGVHLASIVQIQIFSILPHAVRFARLLLPGIVHHLYAFYPHFPSKALLG